MHGCCLAPPLTAAVAASVTVLMLLLLLSWDPRTYKVLPVFTMPDGASDDRSGSPAATLSRFSATEQRNTLLFLLAFTQTIPELQARWAGSNFCAWPEVECRGNGVRVNFMNAPLQLTANTLPELPAGVEGTVVAVTHLLLYGQRSRLQGSLPESWGQLSRLRYLLLVDNALSGTLPDSWHGMRSLRSLFVSLNNLTGALPDSWHGLGLLTSLSAGSNGLTGPLPPSWANTAGSLAYVELAHNALCGCVPVEWHSNSQLSVVCDAALTASNCSVVNACEASGNGAPR